MTEQEIVLKYYQQKLETNVSNGDVEAQWLSLKILIWAVNILVLVEYYLDDFYDDVYEFHICV